MHPKGASFGLITFTSLPSTLRRRSVALASSLAACRKEAYPWRALTQHDMAGWRTDAMMSYENWSFALEPASLFLDGTLDLL